MQHSDQAQQLKTMSTMQHILKGQYWSLIGFRNTSPPAEGCPKWCLDLLSFSPVKVALNVLDYVVRIGYPMVTEGSVSFL